MTALLVAGAAFTLLTLVFLGKTFSSTRRGRILRAGGSGAGCVASGALAFAAIAIAFSYWSYDRLTAEQVVTTVDFRAVGADQYRVRLVRPDRPDTSFVLRGDEWQIDARLINWKPPMTLLGLDPIYRLERLSGRFSDIAREQAEQRTVHELSPERPLDLWQMARSVPSFLLPGVDAYYGTATYVPMADGARYDVSLSRDALIARPANDVARRAVGEWGQR